VGQLITPDEHTIIHGERTRDGRALAWVNDDFPLPHIVHHSPTGLEWGYGGSGPADLALSILAFAIVEEEEIVDLFDGGKVGDKALRLRSGQACSLHQHFKWEYVAKWPRNGGWSISIAKVRRWIEQQAEIEVETEEHMQG